MHTFKAIPSELKQLNNWCVWRFEKRSGDKPTKVPLNANNPSQFAKSNDTETWSSFGQALQTYQSGVVDGIGFFFSPPYVGIDLDHVDDDLHRFKQGDRTDNIVAEFYESFQSYGEISPSGQGIHIIIKGKIPGKKRRKGNVEMYSSGRFFTMTGNSLKKYSTVEYAQKEIFERIYSKHLETKNNVLPLPDRREHGLTGHNLSEGEVIRQALASKQGELFQKLLDGEWEEHYDSQSEADLAFANMLAFWCAKDFGQMDSIFRQSGLYRDKWDRKTGETTYGAATLQKAINEVGDAFNPNHTAQEPLKYVFGKEFGVSKPQKFIPHSYDDTGNADRFMDRFGDFVRYVFIHKRFYVYDGEKWAVDTMGYVRSFIDKLANQIKHEPIVKSENVDEEDARKALNKHVKYTRSNSGKKRIQEEIQHRVAIAPEAFDRHDMLLNVTNGYLDLTSGQLHPHDREKLFTLQANAEYSENGSPDTWLRFLDDIFASDQEMIRFVQKCVGYSITGSTKEQVMFILHGLGRNGKSLFVDTIREVLGDYAKTTPSESLMIKSTNNTGAGNDIARLQGARMATASEPNEGFRFDEGLIKQLTGGENVTARFLYGEFFEFHPKFKIWVTTNHKPIVRGTDDGIWRRLILIPFEVQIPEHKVDKDLKHKLLRESTSILDWALEGCRMWQREGLNPPQKVQEASKSYRDEMDVVEYFIQENCVVGEGYEVGAQELFDKYREWAENSGEYKMGQRKFGMKMKEKYKSVRRKYGVVYLNLRIAPTIDPRFNFI